MDISTRHIYIAAGGTGGHMFPALALARKMITRGDIVTLITDARGKDLIFDFPELAVKVLPLKPSRGGIIGRLKFYAGLLKSILAARKILRGQPVDLIIGFGGYPSLPTAIVAMVEGRPLMLHEQNAYLGKVNRFAARCALKIGVSFKETSGMNPKDHHKIYLTGMPVREEIVQLYDMPFLPPKNEDEIHLFIVGGSQGAAVFSRLAPKAISLLPLETRKRLKVVQQSRRELLKSTRTMYEEMGVNAYVEPFFHNMAHELTTAHLVLARAGSSTVAELTVAGRPSFLVPYPFAADNHQEYNAKMFEKSGGGCYFQQGELTAEKLANAIEKFVNDATLLSLASENLHEAAIPDADERLLKLADICIDISRAAAIK